jgi:iron complex transport system substrate-binding protein
MHHKFLAGLLAGAALLAGACGDDSSVPAAAEPVSTEQVGATVATEPELAATTVPAVTTAGENAAEAPQAIVSLSATATEMLYALDAGDQVLAVDDFSNYPPETADKMVGLDAFEPNVEAIAALEPDLVITDGTNPELLSQFDELGIAHWEGEAPATIDELFAQIEELGVEVGRVGEAAELVAEMSTDIEAALAELPPLERPLTYYHELDNTYYSVTSGTFLGAVYEMFGLVNIADAAGADTDYPQLSAEYILREDPDLIFLACTKYCGETAATVAARPGWDVLSAVRNGGVIEMDDDIASRWGPRIVDYIEQVGAAVTAAAELQPAG